MRRTLAALAAGAVLAVATLVAAASPAVADHGRDHWGHGYRPQVTVDCSRFGGNFCFYTGDAERAWSANGYPNGFTVGNPWLGCSARLGWIVVCANTRAELMAEGATPTMLAFTDVATDENPSRHIQWALMRICTDCGLSSAGLQVIVRHEYGHALGLAHTNFTSVMQDGSTTLAINDHDRATLGSLYSSHDHTIAADKHLDPDESVLSANRQYRALMQRDGNFVIHGPSGPVWAAMTWGNGASAWMQTDGNFVVYGPGYACSTRTGAAGTVAMMQDDGNFVLYAPWGPVWWSAGKPWALSC